MYEYVEDGTIMSKNEWFKWFEANGNHDADGWTNAENWFNDMLRTNLLKEI